MQHLVSRCLLAAALAAGLALPAVAQQITSITSTPSVVAGSSPLLYHLGLGGVPTLPTVTLRADETYVNAAQEVRGGHFVMRNVRTTADDPVGWDFFGVVGAAVADAANTQTINGQMKGVVGEVWLRTPDAGTYTVTTGFGLQAALPSLGAGATLTNFYGLVVNDVPATEVNSGLPNSGTLTTQYGIQIDNLTKGLAVAALNLSGTGAGGRIKWPGIDTRAPSSGLWTVNHATDNGPQFRVTATANSVNNLGIAGAATGGDPFITNYGEARNILYLTNGATGHIFASNSSSSNIDFLISHAASSVNYFNVVGAATGVDPVLRSGGEARNIRYMTIGATAHLFATNNSISNINFGVAHTASAVNYPQVTGGAVAAGVTYGATGSDTNIDIILSPKAAGLVRILNAASFVAASNCGSLASSLGCIAFKDSGGATRYMPYY